MLRKVERMMGKWGHYFLAFLCAGVILLSALWTRSAQETEIQDTRAHSDQSQRLQDATETPAGLRWPIAGEMLDGVHESAVFYPRYSLWRTHAGIDFSALPGTDIRCMMGGVVTQTEGMIEIAQDNGDICRYWGAAECLVKKGQRVKTGETIGKSGGKVHLEEETDLICVVLLRDGKAVDFFGELIEENQ